MEVFLSPEAWITAGIIFGLRVANMALDTIRVNMVIRNRKVSTWILGFLQTIVFVYVLTAVVQDLTNILNIFAYAGGYATGNVVGMWIEERLAIGHINMRIISPRRGKALVEQLREAGYAVTEIPAQGRDGAVSLLNASVRRKEIKKVMEVVQEIDEEAMVTAEDMRPVRRGFWR